MKCGDALGYFELWFVRSYIPILLEGPLFFCSPFMKNKSTVAAN